jgi:murein DD-endopeptidase MepM/ murein hydrolase activator NlpD
MLLKTLYFSRLRILSLRSGVGLMLCLLGVGCTQVPAPYEDRFTLNPSTEETSKWTGKKKLFGVQKRRPHPSEIRVKEGENLFVIARHYGIPLREIIEFNHLKPPYILYKGQKLKLPKSKYHVVRKGDTLSKIAYLYGVRLSALVQENKLKPPYILFVDQVLKLPGAVEKDSPKGLKPQRKIQAFIKSEKDASQGAKLISEQTPERIPLPSLEGLDTPQEIPLPSLEWLEKGSAEDKALLLPSKKIQVKLPPRSQGKFLKPVKGNVVLAYGAKGEGIHNDGINISAAEGAPIKAAENGVVVYTGNGIESFGNLTLIKHADGWISAYGHSSKILVKRGDQVTRGQVIAQVGKTGFVKTPQLHFELRKGVKTVDPTLYI